MLKLLKRSARNALQKAGYEVRRNPIPRELRGVHERLSQIPWFDVTDLIGSAKPTIQVTVCKYEEGMLPYDQAVALMTLLVNANPKAVLEIGTYMGHTTKLLAANLPEGTVHTVDLPVDFQAGVDPVASIPKDDFHLIQGRIVGREFANSPHRTRIKQHFGDSATWDFSHAQGATFFFIDGSHTYEYCLSDSEKCYQLCGGKGTFVWHDCDIVHPGVVDALLEWCAKGRNIVRIGNTPLAYWKSE